MPDEEFPDDRDGDQADLDEMGGFAGKTGIGGTIRGARGMICLLWCRGMVCWHEHDDGARVDDVVAAVDWGKGGNGLEGNPLVRRQGKRRLTV